MKARRSLITGLVLSAAVLLPASASAGLPHFRGTRIVPGRSVAGVALGMRTAAALAKWGSAPDCSGVTVDGTCTYDGGTRGTATLYLHQGKVTDIDLRVSTTSAGYPIFKGPLIKLKTSKRIGLGATLRQLGRAYPRISSGANGYTLGSGAHTTTFTTSTGRIADLYLGVPL